MATCGYCGRTIAFGGVQEGDRRFCNKTCRNNALLSGASAQLPPAFVLEKAHEAHSGPCPKCGGPGPVDIHTSYTIWSAFLLTRWTRKSEMCCQACGRRAKLQAAAFSGIVGWWGIPWGIVMTPAQLIRNIGGLFTSPDPQKPSDEMVIAIRTRLAAQLLAEQHEQPQNGAQIKAPTGRSS